ncbi:sensor domain-containing diguanylate cyclase [Peribacillus kribbensis]|uniref:sensor domain-containing diguanylate cyclase n=1 Tax=Peribacillus kribbensis TaxID=356658 RepID=UPI00040116F9|nr:sensor domain-containing diguanylate cyclase [Peribacillus kribbensis]
MNSSKYNNQLENILQTIKSLGTSQFIRINLNESDSTDFPTLSSIYETLYELDESLRDLTWLNSHLRIVHDFGRTCAQTLDEKVLMEKAYDLVSRVMPTDAFFIALKDDSRNVIDFPFMVDEGEIVEPDTLPMDKDSFTIKVINSKSTLHAKTAEELDQFNVQFGTGNQGKTCIFVPIIIDDKVRGVISAQSNQEFAYRKEHEELLQMIGNQVISSIITAQLYSRNYKMSLTDEMTGLGNYRAFHSDLETFIANNEPLALLMIDTDGLKGINDTYGHHAGDLYIKTLAEGIDQIRPPHSTGYRYSGDEFMIILKQPTTQSIVELFNNLRRYMSDHPFEINNSKITVAFSGGTSLFPCQTLDAEELKKFADLSLYEAKRNGRNQEMIVSVECLST